MRKETKVGWAEAFGVYKGVGLMKVQGLPNPLEVVS